MLEKSYSLPDGGIERALAMCSREVKAFDISLLSVCQNSVSAI